MVTAALAHSKFRGEPKYSSPMKEFFIFLGVRSSQPEEGNHDNHWKQVLDRGYSNPVWHIGCGSVAAGQSRGCESNAVAGRGKAVYRAGEPIRLVRLVRPQPRARMSRAECLRATPSKDRMERTPQTYP